MSSSVNPLASGQQFIMQAPQPQPFPSPFPLPSSLLDDVFSRQDEIPPALGKPGEASENANQKPQTPDDAFAGNKTDKENGLKLRGDNLVLPSEGVVTENTNIDIAGPVVMSLESTTKDKVTVLAGQDLGELFKAVGPELLAAMKNAKGNEKAGIKTEKPTIQENEKPAVAASVEPLPAPKMAGFNTLM